MRDRADLLGGSGASEHEHARSLMPRKRGRKARDDTGSMDGGLFGELSP